MEWELVKPWVNRVGIVLEFLSFWLAAPEILGERRLRTLERRLERGLRALPRVLLILLFSTALVVVTVMFGLLWGWRMLLVVLAVVLAMAAVFWILLGQTLLFWVVLVWELVMDRGSILEADWAKVLVDGHLVVVSCVNDGNGRTYVGGFVRVQSGTSLAAGIGRRQAHPSALSCSGRCAVRCWHFVRTHCHVLGWCSECSNKGARMSEYTREEILKLIEENGGDGAEGLYLRGRQSD